MGNFLHQHPDLLIRLHRPYETQGLLRHQLKLDQNLGRRFRNFPIFESLSV
jgi:hypothetical protein